MKILVTGCAGFIGSQISALCLRGGHVVIGVDNLNTAYDVRLKEWRLSQLDGTSGFTFVRGDVVDRPTARQIFSQHPVDAVVNLAARAGVRGSLADPWVYYETNVAGTLNLLEGCREHHVAKFVLASTSSLYGDGPRPFREDQPTDRPVSPYAASKKAAEILCYTYHMLYGLDVTILRYFTVYGPAGRPDMSPFRFIRWIAEGDPITLYGDGSQERDFTYVDDIAHGTLQALQPLGYEVINLGSDRPVAMGQFIRILERRLERPARVDRRPAHPADVRATWADITKARRLLKWAPRTSLEDGLGATVRWYEENRSWASKIDLGE
ncbi:MAG TPA: NAD-dependent epimerase/dehydratase family protein [bacterium]|nr:NAD-dependent epimerase/dehydratase family protein [bacterium]